MKKMALHYYHNGYNCSQCILKAAESIFRIPISNQCIDMCSAVNTGFGIGGMCSVLIAATMVFGLLFDECKAKQMRIVFLNEFRQKYPSFNCSSLIQGKNNRSCCDDIISDVCDFIEKIVTESY